MKINIEYTDTFGGDANYSWVRRYSIEVDGNVTDLALIRRIKKAAGLNGVRGIVSKYGDTWEFRPYGACVVLFANF